MRICLVHRLGLATANVATTGAIASSVCASVKTFEEAVAQIQEQALAGGADIKVPIRQVTGIEGTLWAATKVKAGGTLDAAETNLREASFLAGHEPQIGRLRDEIESGDPHRVRARAEELNYALIDKIQQRLFLLVDEDKAQMFEQSDGPPFGQDVASAFPESARDIAAAARCLALNEWTASVIHLMRGLESPLRFLAGRVGVIFPHPIELENWKGIVDQMVSRIEAETKRLEGHPRSLERNRELQLLGEAALQMRHFKNAWRNNVAHGREHYDERDAEKVYRAVRDFMLEMASVANCPPSEAEREQ